MPEMLITFKCKEETTFSRCMSEDKIKEEFDKINKKIEDDLAKQTADDRAAKLAEVEEEAAAAKKALEEDPEGGAE